jgi:NitT/TauT family transport system permease protein
MTDADDRTRTGRLIAAGLVAAGLASWEMLGRGGILPAFFFPAPTSIAAAFWRDLVQGTLVADTRATFVRLAAGLAFGAVPGMAMGLLMGWSPRVRSVLDPIVALVHPIPKLAVLPIVMVIFGLGETSKVVVIALGAFFPMLISAMTGVRQIGTVHFEVAEAYGAGRRQTFSVVVLPGSLPLLFSGLRLAFNVALVFTVAVEFLGAPQGLGKMLWLGWQTMRTEDLYAALAVIAALGIGFNLLLDTAATRLAPWRVERPE